MVNLFRKYFFRFLIISISILFLVGCDQTTKKVPQSELKDKAKTEIAGIINLQYIENDGGMLSLGSKLPQEIKFAIFIIVVSVFLIILFFFLNSKFYSDSRLFLILYFVCSIFWFILIRVFFIQIIYARHLSNSIFKRNLLIKFRM